MVRPGVDRNLIAHHVLGDEGIGERDHTRADDEERRLHVVVVKEIQNLTAMEIMLVLEEEEARDNH